MKGMGELPSPVPFLHSRGASIETGIAHAAALAERASDR
jgi:hypothetical protein